MSTICNQLIWKRGDQEGRCNKVLDEQSGQHGGFCATTKLLPYDSPKIGVEDADVHEMLNGPCTDREVALAQEILVLRTVCRDQGKQLSRLLNGEGRHHLTTDQLRSTVE